MQKNSFTILLKKNKSNVELKYFLNDTELADLWYKKIKHLSRVPISKIESELEDVSDLELIYSEFCKFAEIEQVPIVDFSQSTLNSLHEIYEKSHKKLSLHKNNEILYKFHHAIHKKEKELTKYKTLNVGWGINEGLLTSDFNCNKFYEKSLVKNYIYLPWAELGKKPLRYWQDNEPDNKDRFLELAKPHITFRAKFCIQLEDKEPSPLPEEFIGWFAKYKKCWLKHYKISNWNEKDEYSAPLLGIPKHSEDVNSLNNEGYKFERIIYDCH